MFVCCSFNVRHVVTSDLQTSLFLIWHFTTVVSCNPLSIQAIIDCTARKTFVKKPKHERLLPVGLTYNPAQWWRKRIGFLLNVWNTWLVLFRVFYLPTHLVAATQALVKHQLSVLHHSSNQGHQLLRTLVVTCSSKLVKWALTYRQQNSLH